MATNFKQDAILTTYEGPIQGKEDFPEHEQTNWEAITMEEESTELFGKIKGENTRTRGKFQEERNSQGC